MKIEELKALEAKARGDDFSKMDFNAMIDYSNALRRAAPALISCAESLKLCRRELQRACNAANYMSDEMAEAINNADEALRRLEGVK